MSDVAKYANELDRIEFNSDKDIDLYAKTARRLAQELHLKIGMDADLLQGTLSQYRGRWFDFGNIGPKTRARLVAAHLKVAAEALKAFGSGATKMRGSFQKHFVKPERDARRQHERNKRQRRHFTIGDEQ